MKAIELIDFQLSPLLVVMVSCKARTFHSIPSYPMSPNAHPLCLSVSLFLSANRRSYDGSPIHGRKVVL